MKLSEVNAEERTPENCVPVNVYTTYRFNHYKESSQQFKRGIKGRWQEFNGYGWDNVEAPSVWLEAK